jgi:cytochrome bd-type quinol oxidase subunit 1
MGLGLVAVLTPAQMVEGHHIGRSTVAHQPAKLTAVEGRRPTGHPARALLPARPNAAAEHDTRGRRAGRLER